MKVLVTGASGFVGSAVVQALVARQHEVCGLSRSEASAQHMTRLGAKAVHGDLNDLEGLKNAARRCDAVMHLGFNHDFKNFEQACLTDERAIEALGAALMGSARPLVITSGLAFLVPKENALADETCQHAAASPRKSEHAGQSLKDRGVDVRCVRLANSVHGAGDKAFLRFLIDFARQAGFSAYVGQGRNCWSGVHRFDAAELFCRVLEGGQVGATYHGCAEEQIPVRDVAETIARKLNVPARSLTPEQSHQHFTWFSRFAQLEGGASSHWTQQSLSWRPSHPGVLDELQGDTYVAV